MHRMGLYPIIWTDVARTMLLLFVLFSGPLFEQGIVEGNWRNWLSWRAMKREMYDDWMGWRTYVVGPVSEEFMFRSLNVSLFLNAWVSRHQDATVNDRGLRELTVL